MENIPCLDTEEFVIYNRNFYRKVFELILGKHEIRGFETDLLKPSLKFEQLHPHVKR